MEFLNPEPPYILFKDRPEWSDVTAVPQDDGPSPPLAPIMYNDKYKDATSYFRAIYVSQEHSQRVLDLTLEIIKQNASHYTVWQYRYRTLIALNSPLTEELHLLSKLLPTHLKSYQAWNHRRLLLLQLGKKSARSELAFAEIALAKDAKNYHTWVYREWLLCNFFAPMPFVTSTTISPTEGEEPTIEDLDDEGWVDDEVWREEVAFTDRMLEDDVRNNSVWHHRFFVLFEGPRARPSPELVQSEIDYTEHKIALAPNNASAWNYLRGLLSNSKTPLSTLLPFARPYTLPQSLQPSLRVFAEAEERELLPGENAQLPCVMALEFIADALGEKGEVEEANKLFDELVERDPIRKQFWEYRKRTLAQAPTAPVA
ncbi:protein prenylyltransferase [Dacryopinax primogenitus]|uniref:Protein farnesyltransferase/geranylgeranyltransferase type-1 subunit alpha n=1 Tax=Dacryopinax primogenitus (strain DJM 731) TaxID=1858805 RepID=M5G2N3_DACPD|nr:protein prenylyltransferase [Dacryopinax primogenitus]EJU02475.1 protein prenylyltransferase [Dacryopinax primogenitus]